VSRRFLLTFIGSWWALLALAGLAAFLVCPPGAGVLTLLLVLACLGLLGTLLAFPLAGWVVRPLKRDLAVLAEAHRSVARGQPARTLLLEGDRTLFRLGETFNRMHQAQAERLARLGEDRQQVLAVLGAMVEGVIALDAGQRILFVNGRAGELLRFSPPAAEGRPLWEVVRSRPLLDLAERALLGPPGKTLREEISGHLPARHNLLVHAAGLDGKTGADGRGRLRGAVLVLHDISELRWLERVRQEFVANVSHELKTPLSVINVCAETLLDGAVDDMAHRGQFLEQITRQCQRLHTLIQDLLSLARIESGSEVFDVAAVPLGPVVSACLERHRARAESRRQVLEADPAPEPDPVARADEDALEQILDNLLDNAVKYTPEGGRIRIGWRAEGGEAVVEVTDTGIGIPEADQPRIFERFYRVDKARSRQLGGTGLGLSIVKHLAQAMQGSVRVASRPGEGSTFTVVVPLWEGG
jgi:two-component system phosphate regulon sensor histidine kinase PhoR